MTAHETPSLRATHERNGRRAVWGWCLYDWANSAFPTVVQTFVFAAYFTKAIAPDAETGAAQWGWAMAAAGLVIALAGPVLGTLADHMGRRTVWIGGFTALMCLATAGLWWVEPGPGSTVLCLALVAAGTVCFEIGIVFYNALLPDLAATERIGRISGWAWGIGYAGGLVCLVVVLFGLIQASPPPFGLDAAKAEPVRASALFTAAWIAVFTLPLLAWVRDPAPDDAAGALRALRRALPDLLAAMRRWPRERRIGRFLLARMLYIDGLNTLFAFGGVYAAGTFGLSLTEVIVFGIALNVTAGLGAAAFGWIDDFLGPKRAVELSLLAVIGIGAALVLVTDVRLFWGLGLVLGAFLGPVQAASRTFMARLAPPGDTGACFGLYALTGKVTAFLGPAVLAAVTTATDSQRAGMATILVFLVAGGILLRGVPAPGRG